MCRRTIGRPRTGFSSSRPGYVCLNRALMRGCLLRYRPDYGWRCSKCLAVVDAGPECDDCKNKEDGCLLVTGGTGRKHEV